MTHFGVFVDHLSDWGIAGGRGWVTGDEVGWGTCRCPQLLRERGCEAEATGAAGGWGQRRRSKGESEEGEGQCRWRGCCRSPHEDVNVMWMLPRRMRSLVFIGASSPLEFQRERCESFIRRVEAVRNSSGK